MRTLQQEKRSLGAIVCLLFIFTVTGFGIAQDLRTTLFKKVDASLKAANVSQALFLSPKNYTKAVEFYNKAEVNLYVVKRNWSGNDSKLEKKTTQS